MLPSNNLTNEAQAYCNYGYPSMQQAPVSCPDSASPNAMYGQSSYQQFSQVRSKMFKNVLILSLN